MKKMMTFLIGLFVFSSLTLHATNDRPISVKELPEMAQQFIQKHFPNEKISLAKVERDFLETRYEVIFTNSAKVEFFRDGTWKEIDCRYSKVPVEAIPTPIVEKIKELYPDSFVTEIDRNRRNFEVKLNNGLELTFDKKFQLFDIDD